MKTFSRRLTLVLAPTTAVVLVARVVVNLPNPRSPPRPPKNSVQEEPLESPLDKKTEPELPPRPGLW